MIEVRQAALEEAFQAGHAAYDRGVGVDDNPYDGVDPALADAWDSGWHKGCSWDMDD